MVKSKRSIWNTLPANGMLLPFVGRTGFLHPSGSRISDNEVSIQMIYSEQKNSSPDNPLLRPENNFLEILRFGSSSFLSFLFDIGLFSLILSLLSATAAPFALLIATGAARLISSGFNFTLNKNFVFINKGPTGYQLIKYYLLCSVLMFCSWLILYGLTSMINAKPVLLKIIGDMFLFLVSYIVQRFFIFRRTKLHEKKAI